MGQLINSLNQHQRTVTPGERRVAKRLESHLEKDFLCWYDVPVGKMMRYPDFIIIHPKNGLLIFEVKDWKINTLRHLDKIKIQREVGGKMKTEVNPLEQARQCTMELVNQLKSDPNLCFSNQKYNGKLICPYGFGVILTNITRKQLNASIPEQEQENILPYRKVICQDEMTETVDKQSFQERVLGMFDYHFDIEMSELQLQSIRGILFPELRIENTQENLFEENELEAVSAPSMIKVLDLQQEQLARNLGSGHRIIHGVAGSGKTLILGYRCQQLAKILSKPILVLCYNVSLAAKLRHYMNDKGLGSNVKVHHFHEWCGEQIEEHDLELEKNDTPAWERQVRAVIESVKNGTLPTEKYGAVMVDEGHDFEKEWIELVVKMVDTSTDSFLLLYDDAQSIYKKSHGLGFTLSSVGVKAAGRTTILRLNYRNSQEILKFAYDFAQDYIRPQDTDDDHIPLIEPQSGGVTGIAPVFRMKESVDEEIAFVVKCIESWITNGRGLRDIAVIYLKHEYGKGLSQILEQKGLDFLWMSSRKSKKEYDPKKNRITLITAQSSKGLEFKSVILVGVGQMKCTEEEIEKEARLLYVAMTRAQEFLLVTSSEENKFTKRFTNLTPLTAV